MLFNNPDWVIYSLASMDKAFCEASSMYAMGINNLNHPMCNKCAKGAKGKENGYQDLQ
jgi:hypothetical protein